VNVSKKIDVHAHYLPQPYRAALLAAGHDRPDGFPQVPAWSVEEHVDAMDRLGIATSLLSISSPGVYFGDETNARNLAREMNEIGRRAVMDHPGRFGLFASLPLPDVDAAIAEIAYCVDRVGVFARLLEVDASVDVLRNVARLHYDLAGFPVPRQLDALLTITTLEHLHYGSDYPFTPELAVAMAAERLAAAAEAHGALTEALRTNTERLFPALGVASR
jgi:predicted TIM-barrel fold metal-dependent hydrolase